MSIYYTSFNGRRRLVAGPLPQVALAVAQAGKAGSHGPILVFNDSTGELTDLDLRGSDQDILARLSAGAPAAPAAGSQASDAATAEPRGRGRPKLGVVPREVTLLPRHWEWLQQQPGGTSVALRKLVEEARRAASQRDRGRLLRDRAYRFMSAMAGDYPGYEEATRALFADDTVRFRAETGEWPADVRDYCLQLLVDEDMSPTA
jgi:hypothetical protein